jgi:hypothetical protein
MHSNRQGRLASADELNTVIVDCQPPGTTTELTQKGHSLVTVVALTALGHTD